MTALPQANGHAIKNRSVGTTVRARLGPLGVLAGVSSRKRFPRSSVRSNATDLPPLAPLAFGT
eukprot:10835472-Alexandrium_andersonii.AAC.1